MTRISRRNFFGQVAVATGGLMVASRHQLNAFPSHTENSFDPWMEVSGAAIQENINRLSKLSGGRHIIAVVKNNGYGLGIEIVGPLVDQHPLVDVIAVVKGEEAIRLRAAGVRKPILLLARAQEAQEEELVRKGIEFSVFDDGVLARLAALSAKIANQIRVHLYVDTGMGRVGIGFREAREMLRRLMSNPKFMVASAFTDMTEDPVFDEEQIRRLKEVTAGMGVPYLHAVSSHGAYHVSAGHLDKIRPGISIYGAYPDNFAEERKMMELIPAFTLKARVVRVQLLQKGDSVSYGRKFVADKPTWTATIPVGHADGYPREAVGGARVLIGSNTYPAIGAVSASHTIVSLGDRPDVKVGDIASLIGAGHADIHPNEVARVTGTSVYDRLMHLNQGLPKFVI